MSFITQSWLASPVHSSPLPGDRPASNRSSSCTSHALATRNRAHLSKKPFRWIAILIQALKGFKDRLINWAYQQKRKVARFGYSSAKASKEDPKKFSKFVSFSTFNDKILSWQLNPEVDMCIAAAQKALDDDLQKQREMARGRASQPSRKRQMHLTRLAIQSQQSP